MCGGIVPSPERRLVEVDEDAVQGADVFGIQGAVEPFEDGAGGVETAVGDVRPAGLVAVATEVIRGDGVIHREVAFIEDVGGRKVAGVHGAQVGHDRLLDDSVQGAGQQVNPGCGHVAGGVDVAIARPGAHDRVQVRHVTRRRVEHAGGHGDGDVSLRAVIRRAGDHAHAFFDRLRIGKMQLDGEVGAGREAGSGHVVDADVVLRQRQDRCDDGGAAAETETDEA